MGILSILLDLYENVRKTETPVSSNKAKERHYGKGTDEFSGDRRKDLNMENIKPTTNFNSRAEGREDR
jgi:hypothetical protein